MTRTRWFQCERSLELMIPFKDMGNQFSGNSEEGLKGYNWQTLQK